MTREGEEAMNSEQCCQHEIQMQGLHREGRCPVSSSAEEYVSGMPVLMLNFLFRPLDTSP